MDQMEGLFIPKETDVPPGFYFQPDTQLGGIFKAVIIERGVVGETFFIPGIGTTDISGLRGMLGISAFRHGREGTLLIDPSGMGDSIRFAVRTIGKTSQQFIKGPQSGRELLDSSGRFNPDLCYLGGPDQEIEFHLKNGRSVRFWSEGQ